MIGKEKGVNVSRIVLNRCWSIYSRLVGLLRDMQHSVFIFQGMLAGSWGEMHDSRYLSPECINRMWNCMRQYLGDEIYLAVRTPAQWRTLRSEKEFRQKKYAHLALFDDGILGSMTHLGTFGTELREAAGWAQAWTRKEERNLLIILRKICHVVEK